MKKYFYSDGTEKKGPFSFEELKNENINRETLVWFEGLEDWTPIVEIQELEGILELIPPPINSTENESKSIKSEPESNKDYTNINTDSSESQYTRHRGMFSNPFSFKGRIRRTEYGISLIIYTIVYLFVYMVMDSGSGAEIIVLAFIPMLWFLWAQGAKRCHDMGQSGWYQIIPFYVFWMLFAKGEFGMVNKYGANPKM